MIIINADDFGRSSDINAGILKAFEDSLINHTTLMVNMPYVDEALQIAEANNLLEKVGLHLNLTEGKPLYKEFDKRLLDCNGYFLKEQFYLRRGWHRFFLPLNIRKSIYKEFDLQFQKFLSLGFTKIHVDSHNHIHTDYAVYKVLKKLLKKYKKYIIYIRPSKNMYMSNTSKIKTIYKDIYNKSINAFLNRKKKVLFGALMDYQSKKEIDDYDFELMCHPVIINSNFFDLYDSSYNIQDLRKVKV